MAKARAIIDSLSLSESPDVFNGRHFSDEDAVGFTATKDGKVLVYGPQMTHGQLIGALNAFLVRKKPLPSGMVAPQDPESIKLILSPTKGPGVVMGRLWRDPPSQVSFWEDPDDVPKAVYDRLYQEFKLKDLEVDEFDGSNVGKAINFAGYRD